MLSQIDSENPVSIPRAKSATCVHCGNAVVDHRSDSFCCDGCKTVYSLLQELNLGDYYERRKKSGTFRARAPVTKIHEVDHNPFLYLDDEQFRKELGIKNEQPRIQLYLEGIHCTACLWLVEKLPELLPDDVRFARLDLQNYTVQIECHPNGSLSRAALCLDDLGFRPHPISGQEEVRELSKKISRQYLKRVVIAGAMAGNIMLFAVSIYAGAGGMIRERFDLITIFLALPVFIYSAVPLYQNSWNAIKNKVWSVDIPIVIAVLSGFVMSVKSVFFGNGAENYLDSLTGLIFFLLASRYFLIRIQENAFQNLEHSDSFFPVQVLKNGKDWVWVRDLKPGDEIAIPPGLRIPVDGIVISGQGSVNASLLTGESIPHPVNIHDEVSSGMMNLETELHIRVERVGADTRIGKIISEVSRFTPANNLTVKLADQVGKYFTIGVVGLACVVFASFLYQGLVAEGLRRFLSVLIVSCPCALALATPLALIRAHALALKNGLFLKDVDVLDTVRSVKSVYFDKTGTLTYGRVQVTQVKKLVDSGRFLASLTHLSRLEQEQKHPVAKALLRYLNAEKVPLNEGAGTLEIEIIPGSGLRTKFDGNIYSIRSIPAKTTAVEWQVNGEAYGRFYFSDEIREDAKACIQSLNAKGFEVGMLSGDQVQSAEGVASLLSISATHVHAAMTPEEKANFVDRKTGLMFVGDGANDSIALLHSKVGVAAQGALDLSLRAAKVYLTDGKLTALPKLFQIATGTRKLLIRQMIFTFCYNALVITLACFGKLEPLIGAILMPASSLFVLLSTLVGNRELRSVRRES